MKGITTLLLCLLGAALEVHSQILRVLPGDTQSTSVTITWILLDGVTASSYTISYSNTDTECFPDTVTPVFGTSGDSTSFMLTGLEEDAQYVITVSVLLTGGTTAEDSITVTTLAAVPSASPNPVETSDVTSSSITVQWEVVDCIHRNGDILYYSVRYGVQGSAEGDRIVKNSSVVMYEICGLTSSTTYCIEVAAVNSAGIGEYSEPLCVTTLMEDFFVTFMGTTLPNHSYVDLTLVGDAGNSSDSVQCHTHFSTCCDAGASDNQGDWYALGSQEKLSGTGDVYEIQGAEQVDLRRRNNGDTSGMYRCSIESNTVSNDDGKKTIFIGLYASGGDATISGNITFTENSDLNGGSPQFTLTCTSVGGPATTVTWTRDSNTTSGGMTVLDNPVTAQYTHTLTVTGRLGGQYQCTVSNVKPSQDLASFTVQVASMPTNLMAVQKGPTGIQISWAPPSPLGDTSGYRIYYSSGGGSGSVDVGGGFEASYLLSGLQNGAIYFISIVGTSKHFFSDPVNFPNGILLNPLPGQPNITVLLKTSTTISISWSVPSGSVVDSYEVTWEKDGSIIINDSSTNYIITELEEDSAYIITVTAVNAVGRVVSDPVLEKTMSVESSEFPENIAIIVGGVTAIVLIIAVTIIVVVALCRLRSSSKQEPMRSEDVLTNTNDAYELASTEENEYEDVP